MKTILIAIPTVNYVEPETFKSIYDLEVPAGYSTELKIVKSDQIDQIRNLIADWAKNFDYLFSVDSDLSFPKDTLKKLLAHNVDMVSGVYRQRKEQQILEVYKDGRNVPYRDLKGKGLVEVQSTGFGCLLIKSNVIKSMEYPHFVYKSAIDHKNTVSEDTYFCLKAKEKGFKVFVDSSILCDHHGSRVFRVEDQISQHTTRIINQVLPAQQRDFLFRLSEIGYKPDVVYDIGAGVLSWTSRAKIAWPTAKFIAFDVIEDVVETDDIQYNLEALSDIDDRIVDFYYCTDSPLDSSYANVQENKQYKKRRLATTTLDTVVKKNQYVMPDFIKINVNGAEIDVLKGATEVLNNAKHVIIEARKDTQHVQELIKFMNKKEFDCFGQFYDGQEQGGYHFVKRTK